MGWAWGTLREAPVHETLVLYHVNKALRHMPWAMTAS